MREENEKRWYHRGLRPPESDIREAVRLYEEEGWTLEEIGKKFNRAKSGIHRWITKFAKELDNPAMNKKIRKSKGSEKPRRLVGISAPETIEPKVAGSPSESAEEKIKRLESELAEARLARDFYNEMINVAEKQFNINIRKKAGTRQ